MPKKPTPRKPKKPNHGGVKKDSSKKGTKKRRTYRVRNWAEYKEALVQRGSLMFHITQEALDDWHTL